MHSIVRIISLFLAVSTVMSCAMISSNDNYQMERRLRERIDAVYQAYTERDFDRMLNLGTTTDYKKKNLRKMVEEIEQVFPILIDYRIQNIEISEDKARVKVSLTMIVEGKELTENSFDYWVFQDKDWYFFDFGKAW
ncbi:MAG: hypothetical protein ACYC7J_03895 [Syntrophales bacterium]